MAEFNIRIPAFLILLYSARVYSRHLDTQRDFSSCPEGLVPLAMKNDDGFLKLTCFKPRCEEINKVKAVCTPTYSGGCPKGCWVGSIHREFQGGNEKPVYKTKCCSHPIFSKTIAVKPHSSFKPGDEARDPAAGQADVIDIVTNVLPNSQYDYHSVEITSVLCGKSTSTARTTIKATTTQRPTQKPHDKNQNNNNQNSGGNNGGGGGAGKGGNSDGHHGGNSGGHGGTSAGHHGGSSQGGKSEGHQGGKSEGHHGGKSQGGKSGDNCGPTGCGQPKLEGGAETHYSKQNVPLPGKPPASASDPKAWGISNTPGGGGGAGCFSADTLVQTRRGVKRMDEIQVGDEVLSSVSWDGNSAVSYQPVTQFIHKDPSVFTRYTVISTTAGRSLSLTPYHLLPQFECRLLERPAISVREYELLFTQSARFASRARAGQCVLVVDPEGRLVAERITNVTSALRQGVFSPITASGIIVANGVQASCYSSVENHAIQHAFFTFVHKISQACKPYVEYAKRLFSSSSSFDHIYDHDGQIPTLLRIMLVLSDMVMGSSY